MHLNGSRSRSRAACLPGLGGEVDDRAALGDHGRVGCRADVVLDPFGRTSRGLVCAGLVLADSDSDATLVAPTSCVADEAGHASDEVLDLVVPLLELVEELRSTLPGVAANDCVHHCLLETRLVGTDTLQR